MDSRDATEGSEAVSVMPSMRGLQKWTAEMPPRAAKPFLLEIERLLSTFYDTIFCDYAKFFALAHFTLWKR